MVNALRDCCIVALMATASVVACAGVASGVKSFQHYDLVVDKASGSVQYVGTVTGSVQHSDKLLFGVALLLLAGALARGAWRLQTPQRPLRRTLKRVVPSNTALQTDRASRDR